MSQNQKIPKNVDVLYEAPDKKLSAVFRDKNNVYVVFDNSAIIRLHPDELQDVVIPLVISLFQLSDIQHVADLEVSLGNYGHNFKN